VDIGLEALEPRLFSFDGPWGACPECTGLGSRRKVDPELVVPDEEKSLSEGAVAPWTNTGGAEYHPAARSGGRGGRVQHRRPWRQLPATAKKVVLHGFREQIHITCRRGALPGLWRRPAGSGESPTPSSRRSAGDCGSLSTSAWTISH
jgi:excinuclease ABC subunit A